MNDIPDDEPQNALPEPPARKRSSRAATATVLLLLGLHALGFKIMYIPLNRVIENRFCRSYYLEHDPSVVPSDGLVPEKLCKVNEVQQQLAALFGTVESFHLFIGVCLKPDHHQIRSLTRCQILLSLSHLACSLIAASAELSPHSISSDWQACMLGFLASVISQVI
jgi:hypothetical protein